MWRRESAALGRLGLIVVFAGNRSFELADPFPQRAPQLRKPFRPEDDQGDDENDRYLPDSDIRHRNSW
jgi:hypothetical protein